MKKSTADHMHRKRRKNNLVWLFALLGILVLFLGTILAFLIFSNLSSKPTETVQEVSAVNGTGIVLPSHFTERKITDPSTARDAINDVADTLGIVSVEDELGTADCSTVLGDTYYSFPQVYRGIPVYGRKVTVSADADSEAALLTSGFYPIENLSVEAKITQNDAEKIVAGLYPGEADIYVNNLVIFSLDKTNPELAWKISVHQNNSWESVFLSAVDGRALKTFSNELTDNESSSNRFTNVYLYNAENRDIEVDFRIIFDDGTTWQTAIHMNRAATFVNGKHPMQPRKHRSKVTQDTFMSSIHCPNRNGSLAQSHGSRQRNAASGKEVI